MKKKFMLLLSFIICATMLLGIAASNTVVTSAAVPIRSTINMTTATKATVIKGYRYKMKAVINGKIVKANGKWRSSNKTVATVTKTGVVKAVKAGTTTITVKYRGKTLKTVVIVTNTCKHVWKINKKATCRTTGKKTCQVCGKTANIAIKDHAWVTETSRAIIGVGTAKEKVMFQCHGLINNEKSNFCSRLYDTLAELGAHQDYNVDDPNDACHGYNRSTISVKVYPKWCIETTKETYCETCGEYGSKTTKSTPKNEEAIFIDGGMVYNKDNGKRYNAYKEVDAYVADRNTSGSKEPEVSPVASTT